MLIDIVAALAFAVWVYLVFFRGGFWLTSERDDWQSVAPAAWPPVAVVIPARNEADGVGECLGSLLRQDYPGACTVILVDDDSQDGTADVARAAAVGLGQERRLQIVDGAALPSGWTGKLWAVYQGIERAQALPETPRYLLLTDADIVYDPGVLMRMVERAEQKGLVLASLMVKLRCRSAAERFLIPAFIFFFQMLYPFSWVNRSDRDSAAAAGGCMLARADVLQQAGGVAAIRDALIDDCALARLLKASGPIWLGLTESAHSIRPYLRLADIRRMVSRSAYAQLQYSPWLLVGTAAGMALTYAAPPLLAVFAHGYAQLAGLTAWILMAFAFQPVLRFYRVSPLWGLALPVIALFYMLYTLDSAYQYGRGRGGSWKGRAQANLSSPQ